jgi:hypothetical protein
MAIKSKKLLYKKRKTTLKKYKTKGGGKNYHNLSADKNKIYLVVYNDPDEVDEDKDLINDEYLGIIKSNINNEITFEPYYLRQLRMDKNYNNYYTEWIKSKLVRKKINFAYHLDYSDIEKIEFFCKKSEIRERMKDVITYHSTSSSSFSSNGKTRSNKSSKSRGSSKSRSS